MSAFEDLVDGLQAYAESVRLAANNPADAIRLLSVMAAFDATPVAGLTAIPMAMETTRASITAAARRAALASLALACAAYQPTSYDDALALREAMAVLFDAEILRTADAGDRRCYLAFRTLRTAVVDDLRTRGSALPRLAIITRRTSFAALALAQQLYQDATRTEELIAGAGVVPCPAFMPLSFKALAS